jgi:hypothetical protein
LPNEHAELLQKMTRKSAGRVDAPQRLSRALAMRTASEPGSACSPSGILRQGSLLELFDLGVLSRSHLINQLLNRRNVPLANLYELHARQNTAIAELHKSPDCSRPSHVGRSEQCVASRAGPTTAMLELRESQHFQGY